MKAKMCYEALIKVIGIKKDIPMRISTANNLSHPDFTVGAEISSARRKKCVSGLYHRYGISPILKVFVLPLP